MVKLDDTCIGFIKLKVETIGELENDMNYFKENKQLVENFDIICPMSGMLVDICFFLNYGFVIILSFTTY